jgi:hypothetical protein
MRPAKNSYTSSEEIWAVGGVASLCAFMFWQANEEGMEHLRASIPASDKRIHYAASAQALTFEHVQTLQREGIVVIDDVLSDSVLRETRADIAKLHNLLGDSPNEDSEVRTDEVFFLTGKDRQQIQKHADGHTSTSTATGLLHVQKLLRGLAPVLQCHWKNCNKGLLHDSSQEPYVTDKVQTSLVVPDQVQLALYESSGTHYSPHRDGVQEGMMELGLIEWLKCATYRARHTTAILYLNNTPSLMQSSDCEPKPVVSLDPSHRPSGSGQHSSSNAICDTSKKANLHNNVAPWNAKLDGGCLRCYLGATEDDQVGVSATSIMEIEPIGGRLILFSSKDVLHEVMPTFRNRWAATVWFMEADAM